MQVNGKSVPRNIMAMAVGLGLATLWGLDGGFPGKSQTETAALGDDQVKAVAEPPLPLPRPMPKTISRPPESSIFGFSGHMMHNDLFYKKNKFSHHWRLEYTLPWLVEGRFGCMREPLYQAYFDGPSEGVMKNRRTFDSYLALYDKTGIKVLLCPLFTRADMPGFKGYFEWLGEMAKNHPSVIGVEMHNEPNLRFFWGWGPESYVNACRAGAEILRSKAPKVKIVVGSISHLWWSPGVQFLETVLKRGALDYADGVSTHPYRKSSAPEGGHMRAKADDPCGFEKEVYEFWALVQKYNPTNKPLGLYFTEFGYSSGKGESGVANQSQGIGNVERQADYLSRTMLLMLELRLRGVPLEGLYWYDLKCDGPSPGGMEANFGLLSYDATQARPGFACYSRIAQVFGNLTDWTPYTLDRSFESHPEWVKSLVWQRISDGALIVAFWRMNQLQKTDEDFDAVVTIKLPQGFRAASVELQDLHNPQTAPREFTVKDACLKVPLRVTSRASWLVLHPKTPGHVTLEGPWKHTLPATFDVPDGDGAVVTLEGSPKAVSPAPFPLRIIVDNRRSGKPFSGAIMLSGRANDLVAKAGERFEMELTLATTESAETRFAFYHLLAGGTMFGRGDFTIQVRDRLD